MRGRSYARMGSRLLPLFLALAATLADFLGAHGLGGWLVLLAVPAAAAAVVVAAGERAFLRTGLCTFALALFLLASAVRHGAPVGAAVPALAVSAVIGAAIVYVLPVLFWVLQPVSLRPAQPSAS